MNKNFMGQMISEATAMFLIIAFGDSVAAMYTLYTPSPYQQAYWGVCIAWGLAVTLAIYTTASVSGCHGNPAVTLSLAIYRKFPWRKVLPYCAAQTAGAFLGAAVVYLLFSPVIDQFNAANHLVRASGGAAGVFFTHPGLAITPAHAFMDQTILTAFLIFGIFAITEKFNEAAPGANGGALMIGLLVALIGASMGYLEAWAINPARDFGPRLFCFFAGWGSSALPSPDSYWWIPIVAPLLGSVLGGGAIGASMGYLEAWAINPARDFGPRLFCFFAGWGSSALPSPDSYWWIPIVAPLLGSVLGGGAYQMLILPFLPARERALLEQSEVRGAAL